MTHHTDAGPNMNLVKDPRWGRAQEVYSEDVRLSSALTIGYVTGIQGASADGRCNRGCLTEELVSTTPHAHHTLFYLLLKRT